MHRTPLDWEHRILSERTADRSENRTRAGLIVSCHTMINGGAVQESGRPRYNTSSWVNLTLSRRHGDMATHPHRGCLTRTTLSLSPFVFVLLFAVPLRAAEWPVPRGASNEPVPYHYDPETVKKVPSPFLEDAAA